MRSISSITEILLSIHDTMLVITKFLNNRIFPPKPFECNDMLSWFYSRLWLYYVLHTCLYEENEVHLYTDEQNHV